MGRIETEAEEFWFAGPAYEAEEIIKAASTFGDDRQVIAISFIYRWKGFRENPKNRFKLTQAIARYYEWDSKRKMIAFPGLLISPAKAAKMELPPDHEEIVDLVFDRTKYPHFGLYVNFQLGRKIVDGISHWRNAVAIAAIPVERVPTVTEDELFDEFGCQ